MLREPTHCNKLVVLQAMGLRNKGLNAKLVHDMNDRFVDMQERIEIEEIVNASRHPPRPNQRPESSGFEQRG